MNCQQAERWILLMRSGELPLRKQARLERHVSACPRCGVYREDVDRVLAVAEQVLSAAADEPGAAALAAIRNAARDGIPDRQGARERMGALVFVRWRPLLACAAAVLICAVGWHMLAGRLLPSPGIKVSEVTTPLDFEDDSLPSPDTFYEMTVITVEDDLYFERVSDLARRPDVSLVDRELMILEGLAI